MNPTLKNFLVSLATAALIANVACLWAFNARLARIETILEIKLPTSLHQ